MSTKLGQVSASDALRALQRAGLQVVREGSNHTILWKEGLPRPVPVPRQAKELKRGLLADIIKQAGLTQEEFRKHLR
jgi:predicted RNA binding protein YcfA (HicA-like mRNA interferase family)